ncbi:MAG: family 20 glycosylhydrolase, partial [Draconibacterium sp.]|nr:family 20 glycosylhydrolase [Draconibacterium sp.]
MSKFQHLLFAGFIVFLYSCQTPIEKPGEFKLLPQPQHFEIEGSSSLKFDDIQNYSSSQKIDFPINGELLENIQFVDKQSKAQIIFSIDNSLEMQAEGYTLSISRKQITINGKDKAGLFYGFQTLEQLLEDAKEQDVYLPLCKIIDFPSLAYRAIHLDIKHHMDKTEYYYKLIDKLASYKVNAIIVELEDKLKYVRQSLVGAGDALSISEWQELSNYAMERNIEISPLVQGLGHAPFVLKHEEYAELRDDPKSHWAFNPLDPKTYEVQFGLYLDAIEATPHGKYLHIGGDEVHTTGRNSGKSALELQLVWLGKVSKFADEHNRIPIFWDDMPLKQAGVYRPMFDTKLTKEEVDKVWKENEHKLLDFLDQFPKNCIYMRWNYSSPQAIGNSIAMEWFRSHGLKVMGATAGQTRWVLMPQNESNIDNIKSFAASSINNNLNGLLLTLWDDDSPHFELYKRGILAFAEYSWTGEKRTKDEVKSAYRQREFSNSVAEPEFAFIDELEGPVAFWKNALLKGNRRNYLIFDENAMDEMVIDLPDSNKKGEWSAQYAKRLEEAAHVLESCDSIAAKISTMKSMAIRNIYSLEVYEQVNELVRFTPKALLALKVYDEAENEKQKLEALKNVKQLSADFQAIRMQLELVYGKTRILTKPDNYIL